MTEKLIEFENLKFHYTPTKPILNLAQFELKASEKLFLFGPSGSGKSTFLNLVAGVLKPTGGELTLFGQKSSELSLAGLDRLRGQEMGYIFQSFNLIPYLSVLENTLLPTKLFPKNKSAQQHRERAQELLTRLGLAPFQHHKASELSIGQQQRVAQARALINTPKLLIADEPTSSLDEGTTHDFMKLLIEQVDQLKIGLLFVSHDQRLKSYFDRHLDLMSLNQVSEVTI